MRKLLFIIVIIVMASCANNSSIDEKSIRENTVIVKEYSTSVIAKEKFLEFYDLKLLLKNKPEFEKNISNRLADFKLDSTTILKINKNSVIKNLEAQEIITNKENSSVSIKLRYIIVNNSKSKKDSLLANIINTQKILDGKEVNATKVKFSRFKD